MSNNPERVGDTEDLPDDATAEFQYDWPPFDIHQANDPQHSLEYLAEPPPVGSTFDESLQGQGTVYRYFDGISSNAIHLNISIADLLDASARSPFEGLDFPNADFTHLPPSLRPTSVQCRYHHHPFFDCIPIPSFRDRAILASSITPPLINRFDLCYDMYAGGLVWRYDSTLETNWHYSPEFRQKWRALIEADTSALQRHAEASGEHQT